MTHFTEVALGAAVVATLGAGAMALLLQPEPQTRETILPPVEVAVRRSEPLTDAQRLATLEHRLMEIAAEQRRIIDDLNRAVGKREER